MKELLSDRINNVSPSKTIEVSNKCNELISQGKDVISLSIGEPDFGTPDFIKAAAIEAVEQNYNKYSPIDGYPELKDAIIEKFKRDNDLTYQRSQIAVSTGAKQCLHNLCMILLSKGDEALLPTPFWVSYQEQVKMADGTPVPVESFIENNYKITPEALEQAITPKTKLMMFSSPSNPVGCIYSKEELEGLAKVLKKYPNIIVISDEIYEHLNFTGKPYTSIASIEGMYNQTVVVNGLSKSHAMTGWRLGYVAGAEWVIKAYNRLQGHTTGGTNCIAQRTAITALKTPISEIQYMVTAYNERRNLLTQELGQITGFKFLPPEGAFYLFPDISYFFGKKFKGQAINTATEFCNFLIEEALVAVVPGEAFMADKCIRISYATSIDLIRKAVERIKKAISLLE